MSSVWEHIVQWFRFGRPKTEAFVYPPQELLLIVEADQSPSDKPLPLLERNPLFTGVKRLKRSPYAAVMAQPADTWSEHCLCFSSMQQVQDWLSQLPPTKGRIPLYLEMFGRWDLMKLRKLPWEIVNRGYQPTFVGADLSNEKNSLEAYQRWINKGASFAIGPELAFQKLPAQKASRKLAEALIAYQIDGCYVLYEAAYADWAPLLTLPNP